MGQGIYPNLTQTLKTGSKSNAALKTWTAPERSDPFQHLCVPRCATLGSGLRFSLADPQALQALTSRNWLALIHPVLMILFVYPVTGATIRLGILARERRLQINPIAETVPIEHAQHGAWVTGGVLVAVLIGLSHSLVGAASDTVLLLGVVTLIGYLSLLRSRLIWQRLLAGSICWGALLTLGLQPAVERLSDQPWTGLFWQSHFWMGWILTGLLLSSTALQPLIGRSQRLRRWHVATNVVVALLLAMQAISGSRNLVISGLQTLHGAS